MKLTYRKFDAIIGNSMELSRDLGNYLNLKVKTIYNTLPSFREKNYKIKKIRGKILNIGRLEKQKDQVTLIKAVSIALEYIDLKLTIIGNGYEYNHLVKLINKYGIKKNVKILKNITNPKPFYLKHDLFVLTSIYEGFPNVISESLSMNLQVIASNCKSGVSELLMSSKGPNIFSVGNHQELAKKLLIIIEIPKFWLKTINLKKSEKI